LRPSELSEKQKAGISVALDDISADRDDSQRTVRGYVILEMLGKGAYGAVYKARRRAPVDADFGVVSCSFRFRLFSTRWTKGLFPLAAHLAGLEETCWWPSRSCL
jgi:hypothetical protein